MKLDDDDGVSISIRRRIKGLGQPQSITIDGSKTSSTNDGVKESSNNAGVKESSIIYMYYIIILSSTRDSAKSSF